jgi:isoleucyl-tRNA synthetase
MDDVLNIVQAALSCRDKLNLGVRWPLPELIVDGSAENLTSLIIKQVNVKKVVFRSMDVELKVKPNYKTLGKDFGNNTHKVVELINEHALKISEHIKANKAYSIEGFEITSSHVIIDKVCPDEYIMADIKGGSVYLNKNMTKDLEIEGYAREVMRRVQQLRKDSNLNKKDVIELYISTDLAIEPFDEMIKDKCGAKKILFSKDSDVDSKYDAQIVEKIKGKEVKIGFNKM